MGETKVADDILQIFAEGRVDARSLSGFMSEPASEMIDRRLAAPTNTFDYFLEYMRAIERVYTQKTGVVNVNGVQVKAITQAVIDALNSAAIDNNTQVDTLITATPQGVGMVARTQAQLNLDVVNAKTFGANSNADSAGIKKAIDYAVANNAKVVFNFDAIIKVPSHAANISDAIHSVASIGNRKFTVLIESGHALKKGVYVENGDYSNFTISSVDPEIAVADTYTDPYIVKAERATAPIFDILIDGKHIVDIMLDIQHNSTSTVNNRKGVRNPKGRGVYLNGSSHGYMNYLISTGATIGETGRNLWVSRNSDCECGGAFFDGAGDYNVWVSRASNVYGESCTFKNAQRSLGATRFSTASFNLATISNVDSVALSFAAFIYLNDSTATMVKQGGLVAEEGGTINARDIVITADTSSALLDYGLKADSGATISAVNSTITGFPFSLARSYGGATINVDNATLNGKNIGLGIDCREAGTVSAKSCKINNVNTAIDCRGGSTVSASFAVCTGILVNTVYTQNVASVDFTFGKTNTLTGGNFKIFRGATIAVQAATVDGTAIATTDTNVAAFNTWTANGAIFT